MTEARANLVPGKRITKAVSLVSPLGSGGMGSVWLADHAGLKTQVVVKFMLGGLDASETARSRFSREAAAAAQVKSPHVVHMLDHGVSDDGIPFIVMEHLDGHDLGDEIARHGALEPAKVVPVIAQVAKALSKVHAAGLLHRDIKPDNIFLCAGEEEIFVKLLDFGVAKSSTVDPDSGSLDGETKTGQIVGTPFYMSPEQVTAQKVIDHRSDLWALGVVAYQALTGERPFDGPSFGALAVKIATGTPRAPSQVNPTLPPAFDAWFAKACARSPADRFASAKEMAEALRAAFDGVVSLPPNAASSGSGEREVGAAATEIALAATARSDSESERKPPPLGRSEAGVTMGEVSRPAARGASLLFLGGAVALSVIVWRTGVTAPPAGPDAAVVPSVVPAASPQPPASVVVVASAPPVESVAIPAHDAGLPQAPRPAASARPPVHAAASSAPARSAPEPVAKPPPRPAGSEPDLF